MAGGRDEITFSATAHQLPLLQGMSMKNILFQALANAADGAFVIDEDQRIIYWNQSAEEILGHTYDEVTGQPCYEILDGHDERGRLICREHCRVALTGLAGGAVTNFDAGVHSKSDDECWINMSTFTFRIDDEGASSMLVHLLRDITQKKQNEQLIYQILEATKNLQHKGLSQANPPASAQQPASDLTGREREVLSLLAQGFSTRDIARSLSISPSTARNHIRNILQKLQVHSRLEAVVYALEHGLVSKD
ncbi:MAG: LuxR C-terminal-related transcriptional regulator [Anaerolineae bacterium]|jgi:PAS domain S-box-containing protein